VGATSHFRGAPQSKDQQESAESNLSTPIQMLNASAHYPRSVSIPPHCAPGHEAEEKARKMISHTFLDTLPQFFRDDEC